ncbi:MAG: hypothetical protein OHK0022_07570 [Roseiflexaceae bacterium]
MIEPHTTTPSLNDYMVALQALQSRRLRRDHGDLAAEPQYKEIGRFFFEEMYGPRDFSARDNQAHRLQQFVHLAPGLAMRDVQQVLQLLELTNKLDHSVASALQQMGAPLDFDEPLYEQAYRLADNYDDRVLQLELVRESLYNVWRLIRRPLLGHALNNTQSLAHMVGMSDIHRFLRMGYQAMQTVKDVHRFVETIDLRERRRLDRIYGRET